MLATIAAVISFGAGRPGISAVVMTMFWPLMCSPTSACLLGLVFRAHRLGVAGGRLRLLELVVLDGDELGAERGDLLFRGRAYVRRRDDGAEATRRRDGLQARDAGAHHEHLRRRHRAGRRHHHRQRLLEHRGGIDHRLVAGEVGLARQHVHRLRPRDARHELHREQRAARGGKRIEPGAVVEADKAGSPQKPSGASAFSSASLGRRTLSRMSAPSATPLAAMIAAPAAW